MNELFAAPDVNAHSINMFFEKCRQKNNDIHAMSIYINNEKKFSFSADPYSPYDRREIYSLSKSFTSAAIGAAWDEGLIDLDEKLTDIFPDKLPEKVSENLGEMTVRHCLTMTTGHEACVMSAMAFSDDPARGFLQSEVGKKPGTYFVYNTGSSCMLGLILERKTGRRLFDYAYEKILEPLGIADAYWTECAAPVNEGGIGLHISCRDIEKFGLMLANGGVFNGKRILSQEWVDMACSVQVSSEENGDSGTGIWTSGYGFQFWQSAQGGYRGDGLKGQLCMVMPKYGAVVSIVACTVNTEEEIVDAITLVEELIGKNGEPLAPLCYAPLGTDKDVSAFTGKTAVIENNPIGITTVRTEKTDTGIALTLLNGTRAQTLRAGNGRWETSELTFPCITPKILFFMDASKIETVRLASSFTVEDGKLIIRMKHLSDPHTVTVSVELDNNAVTAAVKAENFPEMLPESAGRLTGKIIGKTEINSK